MGQTPESNLQVGAPPLFGFAKTQPPPTRQPPTTADIPNTPDQGGLRNGRRRQHLLSALTANQRNGEHPTWRAGGR